jgi:hypothetical protein
LSNLRSFATPTQTLRLHLRTTLIILVLLELVKCQLSFIDALSKVGHLYLLFGSLDELKILRTTWLSLWQIAQSNPMTTTRLGVCRSQ